MNEIENIRKLIEKNSIEAQGDELHNYLGTKFDPVTIDGQIIRPPIIIFGDNKTVEIGYGKNGIEGFCNAKEFLYLTTCGGYVENNFLVFEPTHYALYNRP